MTQYQETTKEYWIRTITYIAVCVAVIVIGATFLMQQRGQIYFLHCVVLKVQTRFLGGHSERGTPVPIPNTEVKPLSADGTALATVWESRTPPNLIKKDPCKRVFLFFRTYFFMSLLQLHSVACFSLANFSSGRSITRPDVRRDSDRLTGAR